MPFFVFKNMMQLNMPDNVRRSGRKFIVDGMRFSRRNYGWV